MMRRSRLPLPALMGAPLTMLLVGGAAGWFMRDDGASTTGGVSTVVGVTVPADLDQFAPEQRIATQPNPAVIDPAGIIGFLPAGTIDVPVAAAIDLPLAAGGAATVVDAATHEPLPATSSPLDRSAAPSTAIEALQPLATAPSTVPTASDAIVDGSAPSTAADTHLFVDPCVTAAVPCSGMPAIVHSADPAFATTASLDPLRISFPVGGADGFSQQCDAIEAEKNPNPLLSPATRPTVAVLVNQPSTLALTGQWADGATVDKMTMVTSPADDAEWKRSWDQDRVQRNIVACLTLPLDDVRAHAGAGVGQLRANVLAISATGRAEITGQVTLNIPTDGDDALFVERLVIANRGEQRRLDGVLYPTVHVHYAFRTDTDTIAPAGSGLDPTSTRVYGEHAFVEGADCNGWAANQQGRDRTNSAQLTVTNEERNVAGRPRTVTVVDGEVYLDPTMPSGWEGQFCVRLIATDQPPGAALRRPLTLTLSGTTLRSPRTADYSISVLMDGADGQFRASWTGPSGVTVCTEAVLTGAEPGATCAVSSRFAADGVWVAVDGSTAPLVSAFVPIKTAYCNPDDPFGAVADGCSRGFTQPLELPRGDGETVRVVLQVDRTAEAGVLWQDPSQAWTIGPVTSFAS